MRKTDKYLAYVEQAELNKLASFYFVYLPFTTRKRDKRWFFFYSCHLSLKKNLLYVREMLLALVSGGAHTFFLACFCSPRLFLPEREGGRARKKETETEMEGRWVLEFQVDA